MADIQFVLMAYKSNGCDYCRGCVVDRWDSDFEYISTANENDAIEFYAKYRFEDGYDLTVLINGQEYNDETNETIEARERLTAESHKRGLLRVEQQKNKERQEYEEIQRRAKLQKEEQDKKELARLKALYEK